VACSDRLIFGCSHTTASSAVAALVCSSSMDALNSQVTIYGWSIKRQGTGNAVRRPRPDGTADPEQESANLSCAMIPMLD